MSRYSKNRKYLDVFDFLLEVYVILAINNNHVCKKHTKQFTRKLEQIKQKVKEFTYSQFQFGIVCLFGIHCYPDFS